MNIDFTLLKGDYSIYRLKKDSAIPSWVSESDFCSVTRTKEELSIICKDAGIKADIDIRTDRSWRILKINGPLDLSLIGIIADISNLLKDNKIPVFTISTYDTDYILIKFQYLSETISVLRNAGYKIIDDKQK
jgi:uncharacterized protein